MRHVIAAVPALLLIACGGGGSGGGGGGGGDTVSFQPGQWETTIQVTSMNMPGMPKGMAAPTPPPTTVRNCLTAEQARQPSADFLTGSAGSGCRSENFSMANGRISGTVQCDAQGTTMRSTMDGQYTATSYEMNMQTQTQAQGQNVDMEVRATARRIGDCPSG
ncbi:MAG TPA: DUF3617 domain-containing protein [Allosphingosinicella sp.]|nr:DUF3617 domain-containing protein [Allosphingosinicella sp.]